jgi:hypothetical protein
MYDRIIYSIYACDSRACGLGAPVEYLTNGLPNPPDPCHDNVIDPLTNSPNQPGVWKLHPS